MASNSVSSRRLLDGEQASGGVSASSTECARSAKDRPGVVFGAFGEESDRRAVLELGIQPGKPGLDDAGVVALAKRQRYDVRPAKPFVGALVGIRTRDPTVDGPYVFHAGKVGGELLTESPAQIADHMGKGSCRGRAVGGVSRGINCSPSFEAASTNPCQFTSK